MGKEVLRLASTGLTVSRALACVWPEVIHLDGRRKLIVTEWGRAYTESPSQGRENLLTAGFAMGSVFDRRRPGFACH